MGWADAGATAAHGAGIEVEQLLPREVFDNRGTERLELGLHQVGHWPHGTLGTVFVLEVHVDWRREDVAQHCEGQDREEGDESCNVTNPPPLVPGAEC